jgi:vitamin B12 transporter
MLRLTRCALWLLALLAFREAPAQERDTTALPRVVVTATRTSAQIGSSVATTHVLDGATLREAGVRDLADALRLVPGVVLVRAGGPGAQSSLFLRGGESDYVRVLIDGVPMNDPGGSIDLASLTLEEVDRIEVVRGPASVLYGSDAVTGVVQVFTRRSQPGLQADIAVEGGSRGERHQALSLGAGTGPWSFRGGVGARRSRGVFPFNNDYRNEAVHSAIAWAPAIGPRLSATARHGNDRYHYPTDGGGNVVDRNAWRADRRTALAIEAASPLRRLGQAVVAFTSLDGSGRTLDAPDGPADTVGLYDYRARHRVRRRTADARLELRTGQQALVTVGAEWSRESHRSIDSSNYAVMPNAFGASRDNRAVYLQWIGEGGPVEVVAGGRYDDNDTFGAFRTWRAGVAAQLWRGARLRTSVGTAFKSPTFLEQFNTAFTTGNPALTPERASSAEIGITQSIDPARASVSLTAFDQRFRDLIQYTFLAPDRPNFFNIAAARARGIELEGRASLGIVDLNASSTLLRTRVDDAGYDEGEGAAFVLGRRLLRRPSGTFTLAGHIRPHARLTTGLQGLHVGHRDDLDFSAFPATPVRLSAYTRVDAWLQWDVTPGDVSGRGAVSLLLRADNLGGARYAEVHGFTAPGRTFVIGLRAAVAR